MLPSGTRLGKAKLLDRGAPDVVGFQVAAAVIMRLWEARNQCQRAPLSQRHKALLDKAGGRAMTLLKWALIFFVVSIVAGVLGFTGISAASADVARFLFYVFVVIFLVLLILGLTIFRA
jgi:uncharacterized membrane protein YtjA (UPF0391 family)